MCSAGSGPPPGVLASHDHGGAAPQSRRHGESSFVFLHTDDFFLSFSFPFLHAAPSEFKVSPSALASLRSPLMFFSLVNYASAFPKFSLSLCPSLRLSLMCFSLPSRFFSPLPDSCSPHRMADSGSRKSPTLPPGVALCNSQSWRCPCEAERFWADVSQPCYGVSFFSESLSR